MAETGAILAWTLVSECPIPDDVGQLLVSGETAVAAYKTFRDSAIFTNKRLIVRDAQGLTGKKIEIYSLPYANIYMWSSENGHGLFNFNSEIDFPRMRELFFANESWRLSGEGRFAGVFRLPREGGRLSALVSA